LNSNPHSKRFTKHSTLKWIELDQTESKEIDPKDETNGVELTGDAIAVGSDRRDAFRSRSAARATERGRGRRAAMAARVSRCERDGRLAGSRNARRRPSKVRRRIFAVGNRGRTKE